MTDPFSIQSQDKDLKHGKLDNFSARRVEGDYFPTDEPGMRGLLTSPIGRKRIYILSIVIFLCILILGGRILWLQVVQGQDYRNIAEGNRIRIARLLADRGLIYDRNLQPLVKNVPNFSLAITPGDLPKDEQEKQTVINKILDLTQDLPKSETDQDIWEILRNTSPHSYQPIRIFEHLDYAHAMSLALELDELPGVSLVINAQREYLDGQTFSHVLGYVGNIAQEELDQSPDYLLTDLIGKTGLELQYEDVLKGINGQKRIEVNSFGKEERIESLQLPQTGYDLILSLDSGLQKKIAEVLLKYIKIARSRAGAVIALDPQTGEILSLYSWPTYDNNVFITGTQSDYQELADDPDKPFVFRAISGEYASGSVIKPVIAAGALSEGIINKRTTVSSYGGIQVGQWFFADWKKGGHGLTDITKALAESVNTFFYYIGGGFKDFKGLGIDGINYYAKLFGLTQKTGIDLPGEKNGLLATPEWKQDVKKERWYIGDTYHISIGQGDILVTPLQVTHYIATIANGGTIFKPHLVKQIKDPETGETGQILPEIIQENFIDSEHIDLVRQGLRAAVTKGSAVRLYSLPIKVAGKTGTAQVGGDKKPHAWFSGFAPYEDPEIVLTVLIENGGEGSAIAVPAAKEILEYWIEQKES